MIQPTNLFKVTAFKTKENFDTWINRKFISESLKSELKKANILIVPTEGFRDESIVAFPVKTEELFRYLTKKAPEGVTVDLCMGDDDYKELALHADLIVIGTFIVSSIILPVCIDLLKDYIKEKLYPRSKNSKVKVTFTIVDSDKSSRSLAYEGSPEYIGEILKGKDAKGTPKP